ncbi:uncharacterized protein LOC115631150 [Scaptodrosophila lebanonensis]|uniref:Uncharacterized protein LOC115631150 n=1 Tax=Drosophila lebanonensis TaxID=7225 RepID=A0A6J2U5Q1_DROLE|nr:uncharacterized protein LOC115631150 [Scaptodrosophila lebanonensis]
MADHVADDVNEVTEQSADLKPNLATGPTMVDHSTGDTVDIRESKQPNQIEPELPSIPECPTVSNVSIASNESISVDEQFSDKLVCSKTTSTESFDPEVHCLVSKSLEQLQAMPLDPEFSIHIINLNSAEKLACSQNPKPDISDKLYEVLCDQSKCSTKVFVGKYKFRCHLSLLKAYSKYFFKCKETNIIRLPPEKITPTAFHSIYNWILNIKDGSKRNLVEIISGATFLEMDAVLEACWSMLNRSEITENVAFQLFCEASKFSLPDFESLMLSRISKFFLTLVASREFIEMNAAQICKLLNMHNVGVNSEIEIFMSALRWLSHEWPARQPHLVEIMECVRFGLLPPLFLRYLQNAQDTRVMHHISNSPEVQDMINNAFIYASTEMYCTDYTRRCEFLLPNFEVPVQRRWIFDKDCAYHHDFSCPQRQFFTYNQFLQYLLKLQATGPEYWQKLPIVKDMQKPIACCSSD